MKRKTLYVILGLVAVAAAIAGGLIWRARQQSAQANENLRSAIVERGDMLVTVSASGHIRPAKEADLSFAISGQVAEVLVEVGDEIKAGDAVARLNAERLILEADRARANLAAAEAQLAKLRTGAQAEEVEATRANLRAAEAQVGAAAAERDQVASGPGQPQIAAAEAEVASALTDQKKAYDFHEKTMECFTFKISKGDPINLPSGDVITATESIEREICPLLGVPEEQARYRLEAANAALEAARARLEEVKNGADQDQLRAAQANVVSAASKRDAARAQLDLLLEGPTEEQIAAAEGRLAQAQASVKQAELAVEQAVLEAPFDATVAAVYVTAGEQASPGLPAVTLVDATNLHVNVAVDELDVGRLARGQTVRLTFDALPDAIVTGTAQQIAAAATGLDGGVVTYDVRIDLAPTDVPIRADMTTNATIVVEELSDVLQIPTWAVRIDRETGQYYVNRRSGDSIERADVSLGARSEGAAQVLDGLSAGDEIVRAPESSPFDFGTD
jgi:HlyD family secretion protein